MLKGLAHSQGSNEEIWLFPAGHLLRFRQAYLFMEAMPHEGCCGMFLTGNKPTQPWRNMSRQGPIPRPSTAPALRSVSSKRETVTTLSRMPSRVLTAQFHGSSPGMGVASRRPTPLRAASIPLDQGRLSRALFRPLDVMETVKGMDTPRYTKPHYSNYRLDGGRCPHETYLRGIQYSD